MTSSHKSEEQEPKHEVSALDCLETRHCLETLTGHLHGTIIGQSVDPTGLSDSWMKRLHVPIDGPTGRPDPGYVRLVGQTSRTDRSDRL